MLNRFQAVWSRLKPFQVLQKLLLDVLEALEQAPKKLEGGSEKLLQRSNMTKTALIWPST